MTQKKERARVSITTRIEASLKQKLTKFADSDHRKLGAYVRKVLREHVEGKETEKCTTKPKKTIRRG